MQKNIQILSVGGSLEKIYGNGSKVLNFTFPKESVVKEILTRLGLTHVDVTYDYKRAKDSMDIDTSDRTYISDWCNQHDRSLIVHGTDTIIETAKYVVNNLSPGKIVILTGALQPACMRNSDAEFNLGGAIIAAQTAKPGVYIVMNGRIFGWNQCRKNPETGHFEVI